MFGQSHDNIVSIVRVGMDQDTCSQVGENETESVAALPREAFTGTLVGHELYLFGGSIRGKVLLPVCRRVTCCMMVVCFCVQSFNDMHVLNLGECVGKWGSANPLQGLRLQRQRQLAVRA